MRSLLGLLRSIAAFGVAPLVALITAPLLAQVLGTDGRGQLAAILQPLTVADAVAAFGIPPAVAYFVARGTDSRLAERLGYFGIGITATFTYAAMILYSGPVASKQGIPQFALVAIWSASLAGAAIAVRRGLWGGTQSWRRLDFERTGSALGRLLGILALAAAGVTSALLFAVAPLVTGILVSFSVLFLASPPRVDTHPNQLAKRTFYRYAALVSVGTIAYTFASRIDQFLLPVVVSSSELGIYVVAVTVAEVPLIVGMVLSRNLVSEVAAGKRRGAIAATYLTAIAIAASAALMIGVASGWAVPLFFGAEFAPAVPVVRVLSIASVFSVASAGASAGLNGLGAPIAAATGYVFPIVGVLTYVGFANENVELLALAIVVLISQALCAATLVLLFVRRLLMTAPGR
ncbi:MAG: hypothetical protein CMF04_00830 [Hyphomonas sp.]|nr:hypothetical protein [Hyphomonas sp.]|tara:strand:+ start:1387 stop:2601 length:1215 start_codon:yes stop_codon:yes gene_type:complete